jgi:hypothetical protein
MPCPYGLRFLRSLRLNNLSFCDSSARGRDVSPRLIRLSRISPRPYFVTFEVDSFTLF